MLEKMFRKEWQDRLDLLILASAGILLYVLAFLLLPGKKGLLEVLSGAVTMIFLPFIGLLLGSSGFAPEFRDGAWAYLFSRPVRRSTIWLTKYAALLAMLAAVLLVFLVAVLLVPGLSAAVAELGLEDLGRGSSLMSLGFLLSWVLLTIGFSLSFLTERQATVVFAGLLIWVVLELGLFQAWLPLLAPYVGYPVSMGALAPFTVLIPVSLALASLLAFVRTDFSQPARRVRDFARFGLPLLAAALILGSAWAVAGAAAKRGRGINDLQVQDGSVYFAVPGKILRFDADSRRLQTIARARMLWGAFSIGGEKLAYVKYDLRSKGLLSEDLWMMNTDGTGAAPLAVTTRENSPFRGAHLYPFQVSPDGESAVFAAKDRGSGPARWLLGRIKADGTGLEAHPLDVDNTCAIHFVGWAGDGRDPLVFAVPRATDRERAPTRLYRLDLEAGSSAVLAENISFPVGAQPARQRSVAFISRDEAARSVALVHLDVESGERRDIVRASSINWFQWTADGSRLGFLADARKLGVYSPAEERVVKAREFEHFAPVRLGPAMTWILGGAGLVFAEIRSGAGYLVELDADLSEKRALPFPFDANEGSGIEGLDGSVLVYNWEKAELWLADLETGAWRKIY